MNPHDARYDDGLRYGDQLEVWEDAVIALSEALADRLQALGDTTVAAAARHAISTAAAPGLYAQTVLDLTAEHAGDEQIRQQRDELQALLGTIG
jgi:hypothetical protein